MIEVDLPVITFENAVKLLSGCTRSELRDHAFGDKEIYFDNAEGIQIAEGYSGYGVCDIHFNEYTHDFELSQVRYLLTLGTLGKVERNDSMGS